MYTVPLLLGLGVIVGPVFLWDFVLPTSFAEHLSTAFATTVQYFRAHFFSWMFVGFAGTVLLLETKIPANPEQSPLSRGFWYDLTIVGVALSYWFFLLPFFLNSAFLLLDHYVPFLQLINLSGVPLFVHGTLAFLFLDFLLWGSHYLRHKIPPLWQFHAMHHSQVELNLFSEFRSHPIDLLTSQMLKLLPLYMCNIPGHTIVTLHIAEKWFLMLAHANLNTGFGPLRYLFVTPLSHRLHHSRRPQHAGVNFGVYLSVWDRLFGTHYDLGQEGRCETGIVNYPLEQGTRWTAVVTVYCQQFLHPFRQLAR